MSNLTPPSPFSRRTGLAGPAAFLGLAAVGPLLRAAAPRDQA